MNLFTKRLGLILAGVVGVGAIAALAIGASFALFDAQTSTGNQLFTAGTVSLNSASTGSCTTDITNMEPGDTGKCTDSVTYSGSLPAYLGAEASASGGLAGELSFSIDGKTQSGTNPVLIGNTHSGDTYYTVTVDYSFSSSADNTYQGANADVDVTFYAVQCSNNGANSNGVLQSNANESCQDAQPASWTEAPLPTYTSTGGVQVLNDQTNCTSGYGGSPCFGPPNTGLTDGTTTSLTVGIVQSTPEADATVTLSWNGNMTFQSNGDSSASCTSSGANSETCTYTDAAHGPGAGDPKEDSYTFLIGSNPPDTLITTDISVMTSDGTATSQAFITTG